MEQGVHTIAVNPFFVFRGSLCMAEAKHISAQDFLAQHDSHKQAVVIDVRDADKFAAGHLDGAINVHKTELASQIESLVPDKHTAIYCHCGGGQSGPRAAQALADLGYTNAHVIDGGWRALKGAQEKR
jgi:rhodanese-related sulfurtransferase